MEVDETFARLLKIGILQHLHSLEVDEFRDKYRFNVRLVFNRKLMSTDVWARDELGALRELMDGVKDRVARHYGLDRYDRPK